MENFEILENKLKEEYKGNKDFENYLKTFKEKIDMLAMYSVKKVFTGGTNSTQRQEGKNFISKI